MEFSPKSGGVVAPTFTAGCEIKTLIRKMVMSVDDIAEILRIVLSLSAIVGCGSLVVAWVSQKLKHG